MGKACVSIVVCFALGCASAPTEQKLDRREKIYLDYREAAPLVRRLESQLKFKRDIDTEVALSKIAGRITAPNETLSLSPVGVFLISDFRDKWLNLSVPGNRVYLNDELVKQIDYENELAAIMALEFSRLLNRHVLDRLDRAATASQGAEPSEPLVPKATERTINANTVELFGEQGVFSFGDEEQAEAVKGAVNLLHRSGYDPRGLVSLLRRYENNPKKSPWDKALNNRLLEVARLSIAGFPPLRNPVVRSVEFMQLRKRLGEM